MRNVLLILITGIFTIGIMGCNSKPQVGQSKIVSWDDWNAYWSKTDPIAFLDLLKVHLKEYPGLAWSFWGPHQGWVKEEHIPRLMQLIDSQEPCAPVISSAHPESTSAVPGPSTIGNEAMHLIDGFRYGRYPSGFSSLDGPKRNPDEIRKWWSERKTR